jgi:DNA repair protein RecO (recombination protein O)
MSFFQTNAIVLQAIKYQDYNQILTLFTPELGLIKLLVKGALSSRQGKGSHTTPLNLIDLVCKKGNGELYLCREVSVKNNHPRLRETLPCLEAACDILKALTTSQMPNKPAPDLYRLLVSYLEKMPSAQDPWAFAASFRLKILRHDGLFGLGTDCAVCQIPLLHHYVGMGESYCQEHAEDIHLVLSDEEAKTILNLAHCRSFRWLQSIAIENHVKDKVQTLFQIL